MPTGYPLNARVTAVEAPPIAEVQQWAGEAGGAVLDTAQAEPAYPPAAGLRRHLAEAMERGETYRYTGILGLPALREALAGHMSECYGGVIAAGQVGITAGCNQAFCLVMAALAAAGDEVILPVPYYFNHQMWLQMQGVHARYLACRADAGHVPDPEAAAALITPRTRAIVLVTPNNPTGAVYPPAVLDRFLDLARERGIALVVDETYKDFLPGAGPPHHLLQAQGWQDNLIQLYSFSKAYCLTGHRVGAVVGSPALLEAVEKVADCVAICAPHPGQLAALYGLQHLEAWREDKRRMMAGRVTALKDEVFQGADLRYELLSAGAYFAYVRHPFSDQSATAVARRLARDHGVLCLPGAAFGPDQEDCLRVAFANLDTQAMPELRRRLLASQDGSTAR